MSSLQSTSLAVPDFGISFSPSLVGVPIATVCPISTGSVQDKIRQGAPFDFVSLPTASTDGLSSIYTASAVMADGSMTTFSSLIRRASDVPDAAEAFTFLPNGDRVIDMVSSASLATIVIGSDSCQTLYSPTMTTVCATTVTPMGYAPVAITDCNQYVTFSRETLWTCAPVPTITPRPAASSGSDIEEAETSVYNVSSAMRDKDATKQVTSVPNTLAGVIQRRELTYSAAPIDDIPMSLPRHLLPENQLRKRQVLVSNQRLISTDLVTVAPASPMTEPEVSPTPNPSTLPLSTQSMHETMNNMPAEKDVNDVTATELSPTRWFSLPDLLRPKHAREAARAVIHKRQAPESSNDSSVGVDTMDMESNSTLAQVPQPMSSLPVEGTDDLSSSLTFDPTSDVSPIPIDRIANSDPPQPTKYYIAPWQEIARGGIPTHIKGLTCYGGLEPIGSCNTPDTDGDSESCECEIADEIWSVTSLTFTRVGTTVVSYTGDAVVSTMNVTKTTSLQFQTTLTTTHFDTIGRVIKRTLSTSATSTAIRIGTDNATVYATTQTTYPSITKTLIPVEADSEVNKAGMPQDSPPSMSTTTTSSILADVTIPSVSYPSMSFLPATEFPLSSIAKPLGMDDTVSGSVDGTVLVTSTIATETVTVPPVDRFDPTRGNGPAETDVPNDVGGVQREVWPSDVWLADISGSPVAVETVYTSF